MIPIFCCCTKGSISFSIDPVQHAVRNLVGSQLQRSTGCLQLFRIVITDTCCADLSLLQQLLRGQHRFIDGRSSIRPRAAAADRYNQRAGASGFLLLPLLYFPRMHIYKRGETFHYHRHQRKIRLCLCCFHPIKCAELR